MSAVKERTADAATSTVQWQNSGFDESVLDFLWSVNNSAYEEMEQTIDAIRNRVSADGLTDEEKMYLIGRVYELRKQEVAAIGTRRNRKGHTVANRKYPCVRGGKYNEIADYVAEYFGLGGPTVRKYGMYKKGIDAVRSVNEELACAILTAKRYVRIVDMIEIGKADAGVREMMVNAIILGKGTAKSHSTRRTRQKKQDFCKIAECVSSLFDEVESTYDIDNLLNDIRMNSEPFVNSIRQLVAQHEAMCRSHWHAVVRTINENIVYKMIDIGEEIKP